MINTTSVVRFLITIIMGARIALLSTTERLLILIIVGIRIALFNSVSGYIPLASLFALVLNGFMIMPEIVSVNDITIIALITIFTVGCIIAYIYLRHKLDENGWAMLDYLSSGLLSAALAYMVTGNYNYT